MRTKTIHLFQFDELSDDAKEKARDWYREGGFDYAWAEEWRDSLNAFEKYFPIKVKHWEVGAFSPSWITFEPRGNEDILELKGVRLWKYLNVHYPLADEACPFTGYCGDEDLLQPYREFMKNPEQERTFEGLMEDCLEEWVKGYQGDMEYQHSDEYIDEELRVNEYEFTEDGERA